MSSLNEKESLLLDQVAKKSSVSQRQLAQRTGMSLGIINVILKKLARTGYIKVTHLNKKKLEYLLTPQGFLEASQKTYEYTVTTIRRYRAIEERLSSVLKDLHKSGYEYFSIHGDGELKDLLETVFFKCLNEAPVTLGRDHRPDPRAIVLNLKSDPPADHSGNVLNVLERIGGI